MSAFFQGWKRKLGVITLALACALSACWVRSRDTLDAVSVSVQGFKTFIVSGGERFVILRDSALTPIWKESDFDDNSPYDILRSTLRRSRLRRYSGSHPIRYGWYTEHTPQVDIIEDDEDETPIAMIHYGYLVVPLAALSAYLILSKPKRSDRSLQRIEATSP